MARCLAEVCGNWTGDGCACRVFGIDPQDVSEPQPDAATDRRAEENERRIGRALALCGDEPTGWPAMIAKILRGEAAAPPAQSSASLVEPSSTVPGGDEGV